MSTNNRDKLIDSLYRRCQVRTVTSKEVFDGLVSDLGLIGTQHIAEKSIEIIRPYKNTGTKLESTADALYAILYPNKDENKNSGNFWNNHEP
jgi:hypothetical protein